MSSLKLSGPLSLSSSLEYKPRMSLLLGKYQIVDEHFAAGCFGQILLAKDSRDSKEVVIKKLPKEKGSNEDDIHKEIYAGRTLSHQNVSKFVEYFSSNEWHFIVFERVYGSDLFHLIEKRGFIPFNDWDCRNIFRQILKAVKHSHDHGVVHRDIKLENILMDATGKITVIDFGLCDVVPLGQDSQKFCGSLDYVAPEVVCKRSYNGFLADVFSLGIVLYTLLFAEFPFVSKDRMNAIKQRHPQPPIAFSDSKMKRWKISPLARDLITRMLKPDPTQRLTLDQVKDHPFMRDANGSE